MHEMRSVTPYEDDFANRTRLVFDALSQLELRHRSNAAPSTLNPTPTTTPPTTPTKAAATTRDVHTNDTGQCWRVGNDVEMELATSTVDNFRFKVPLSLPPPPPSPPSSSSSSSSLNSFEQLAERCGQRPDFVLNPTRWKRYSLQDVPDSQMSARANHAAAFSFLRQLQAERATQGEPASSADAVDAAAGAAVPLVCNKPIGGGGSGGGGDRKRSRGGTNKRKHSRLVDALSFSFEMIREESEEPLDDLPASSESTAPETAAPSLVTFNQRKGAATTRRNVRTKPSTLTVLNADDDDADDDDDDDDDDYRQDNECFVVSPPPLPSSATKNRGRKRPRPATKTFTKDNHDKSKNNDSFSDLRNKCGNDDNEGDDDDDDNDNNDDDNLAADVADYLN